MNRKLFALTMVASTAALVLPSQLFSEVNGQEKAGFPKAAAVPPQPATPPTEKADLPKWEFRAVSFTNDEKESTNKLNDLADEGWQYVGPLGNGLVAFRRQHFPRNQILFEVVGNPRTVARGEKTTLTVTVRAGDRSVLPGAKVTISAGGGKFLPKADTPFDPKDRLHGPYSATGATDQKGQFTTWWVVNPATRGYVLDVEASKEGYSGGKTTYTIRIK